MADNVEADVGSGGETFATDDITGVHYPITKLTFGALDSQTIASSGTGGDDAGTQRVTLATDISLPTGPVTNAGTFVVQEDGAALTALELIDDTIAVLGTATYSEATTKGSIIGAVRNDALASLVDTNNEIAPLQVNPDGSLYVHSSNKISTNNSRTSILLADAVYTATADDVSQFSTVTIQLDSSHDSATDGMTFEFSNDNSNWDDVYTFTYTAADGARRFQLPVTAQYFRVVYTNSSTDQTHFRVQTILHDNAGLTTIHRLVDSVNPDRSAEVVKSAIIAQAAGSGDFVPVQATAAGNLKTSTQEISDGLDIGAGNAGAETARVSISTDDVNLSAIKTATELTDNPIVAHAAAISGATGVNVVGARAVASVEGQTETTAADASQVNATLSGNLITQSQVAPEELVSFYVANTDGAEDSVTGLDAGGATVHNYITSVTISNRHASTNAQVSLLDGSAGAVFWEFPAPATGGTTHNFSPPLKQPTVNTALFVDPSAAVTTIGISIAGYQGQG